MKVEDHEYSETAADPDAQVDTMVLWKVPIFKECKLEFLKEVNRRKVKPIHDTFNYDMATPCTVCPTASDLNPEP
jgi:hypothetical protein